MSVVTAVDPHWLAELGGKFVSLYTCLYTDNLSGIFFSVREQNFGDKQRKKADFEFNRKSEIESEYCRLFPCIV